MTLPARRRLERALRVPDAVSDAATRSEGAATNALRAIGRDPATDGDRPALHLGVAEGCIEAVVRVMDGRELERLLAGLETPGDAAVRVVREITEEDMRPPTALRTGGAGSSPLDVPQDLLLQVIGFMLTALQDHVREHPVEDEHP